MAAVVLGLLLAASPIVGARGRGMADTSTHPAETTASASSTVLIKLAADATEPAARPSQVAGLPGVEQVLHTIEGKTIHG